MKPRPTTITIAILLTALILFPGCPKAAVEEKADTWLRVDADGWTVFTPSLDTKIIYVSSGEGDDANDGQTPETPVATIRRAFALSRNTESFWEQPGFTDSPVGVQWFEDWILLKRGDSWNEDLQVRHGPSPRKPFLVASYGEGPRPVVRKLIKPSQRNTVWSNWAIVGIEFQGKIDVINGGYAEKGWPKAHDILIEDCLARGIYFQVTDNLTIRRSVVVDTYSTSSHSQGSYFQDCNNLRIEECVYDHNGWNETISGAEPTIFNHNMYLQYGSRNQTIRGNIIARASSHGIQMRSGGTAEDNLILSCPIGILLGGGYPEPEDSGIFGTVRRNVIMHGAHINNPQNLPGSLPPWTGN